MDYIYAIDDSHDYLFHHGVKGQKWGVRRYQNQDGTYTSLGRVHYGIGQGKIKYSGAERVTFKTKPAEIHAHARNPSKTAAAATIGGGLTIAATLGIAALTGNVYLYGILAGGGMFIGGIREAVGAVKVSSLRRGTTIDPKTGFRLKNKERSADFDLKHCNPGYSNTYNDGSRHNCALCSVAYDMRRRGYEVTSKEAHQGLTDNQIQSMYKNPKVYHITPDVITDNKTNALRVNGLTEATKQRMQKEPDGSRGIMCLSWSPYAGHAVAYEKNNGKITIMDAQLGKKYPMQSYVSRAVDVTYFRTDDLDINPDQVRKVID